MPFVCALCEACTHTGIFVSVFHESTQQCNLNLFLNRCCNWQAGHHYRLKPWGMKGYFTAVWVPMEVQTRSTLLQLKSIFKISPSCPSSSRLVRGGSLNFSPNLWDYDSLLSNHPLFTSCLLLSSFSTLKCIFIYFFIFMLKVQCYLALDVCLVLYI